MFTYTLTCIIIICMISVVIPAYNEEANIFACLDALTKQTTKREFEVIVVNNNSTDKTATIAKSFQKSLHLRIIDENIKGRGSARFTGFSNAKGNIILSTDADSIVTSEWIESTISFLEHNNCVAVTGLCSITDLHKIRAFLLRIMLPTSFYIYRLLFGHFWLSGFNFGIYKTIYEKAGGFKKELNTLEDIDLSIRVAKIGNIAYAKKNKVSFSGRRFQNGVLNGYYQYFSAMVLYVLFKKKDVHMSDVR